MDNLILFWMLLHMLRLPGNHWENLQLLKLFPKFIIFTNPQWHNAVTCLHIKEQYLPNAGLLAGKDLWRHILGRTDEGIPAWSFGIGYILLWRETGWKSLTLTPGKSGCDFKKSIFNLVSLTGTCKTSNANTLRWMPWDLTDGKSTLVQVMAWCR